MGHRTVAANRGHDLRLPVSPQKDTIITSPSILPFVSVSRPAWRTAAATGLAYLVALATLFVLLFVGPYVVFGAV